MHTYFSINIVEDPMLIIDFSMFFDTFNTSSMFLLYRETISKQFYVSWEVNADNSILPLKAKAR